MAGTCPNATLGRLGTLRTSRSITFSSHQPASPTQKMSLADALNSPSSATPGSSPLAASAAIAARHGTGPDRITQAQTRPLSVSTTAEPTPEVNPT